MGHFNAACGISNITIKEGDEVGFILLAKAPAPGMMTKDVGFPAYLRETDAFRPLFPAVYGEYDGYGRIEKIAPSKTTILLETMFGRPIDDIMECVTCNRGLYESSSEIFKRYFTGSKAFDGFDVTTEDALVPLGFRKIPYTDDEEIYVYGKYSVVIRRRGMLPWWSIRHTVDNKLLIPEFPSASVSTVLEAFSKVSGLFPGYDETDVARIVALNGFYGMFYLKETFAGIRSYLEKNDEDFRDSVVFTRGMWDEFVTAQETIKNDPTQDAETILSSLTIGHFLEFKTGLNVNSLGQLLIYGETYEYLELADLATVLAMVNRMFQPSFCGTQDGSDGVSLALNAVTERIISARKTR